MALTSTPNFGTQLAPASTLYENMTSSPECPHKG
jgi:hypothetical protein